MTDEKKTKSVKEQPQQMSLFSSEFSGETEPQNVETRDVGSNAQKAKKPFLKVRVKYKNRKSRDGFDEKLKFDPNPRRFFMRLKKKVRYTQEKRAKELENLTRGEEKKIEEKVLENTKEVSQYKEKKHKRLKSALMLIFNIALVVGILLWNILSTDDYEPLATSSLKLEFLVVALLLLGAVLFFDTASVNRMIFRKTLRSRWFLSFKSVAMLRYYDAVTPLASGGQAFMVAYLTGRDVPGSTALSIPISKLLFQNISWLTVTGICLILSFSMGIGSGFVSAASVIGFCLCLALVLIILFVSKSKTVGEKLVPWCLRLLCKMHIVKDYDKAYQKSRNFVEDYQRVMDEYGKSKFDVFLHFILHLLRSVAVFCIPYFIYCAFMGWSPDKFGEFFMYTALIDLASSFIPLPGGTGMNEITFTVLFQQYLGGYTFWALLFWRFCSYYYYLLQGLVVQAYDAAHGNKKYLWTKKKFELQEESRNFKREQIESFRKEREKRRKNAG